MGAKKFGGLERYMLELAQQLELRKSKLILVFDDFPKAEEYLRLLSKTNAEWFVIPSKKRFYFLSEMNKLFRKYRPEVLHSNFCDLKTIFTLFLLKKRYRVQKFYTCEHCYPEFERLQHKIVYYLMLNLCDIMLTVSEKSKQSIQKAVKSKKNKVERLYLGVENISYDKDLSVQKYKLDEKKVRVVTVAYSDIVKGVDVLLEAISILKYKYKQDCFIIYQIGVGKTGISSQKLFDQAKRMNIEDSIRWLGIQNNVPEILSGCDVYCQPSRSEGIPLSIMEASFSGLPTVASRVGGIPEVVLKDKTGLLVSKEKPEELAQALKLLINNEQLRIKMGTEAKKYANINFNRTVQVSKLIDQYYEQKNILEK